MRHLKGIIIVIILASEIGQISGQQVPMYSQYIMNGFLINPSLAGRDGYTAVNLTVREQWIGIKGGPSTFMASFQMSPSQNLFGSRSRNVMRKVSKPVKSGNMGLGGYVFNDNNGIIHRTGFQADYAYHIPFGKSESEMKYFSMGLALVTYQLSIKTDDLNYSYSDDPLLNSYDKSVFITDFNFGTSYVTSKYYLGFSMTNLLRGSLIYGNSSDNKMGEIGHYFLTGGVNIPIDKDWSVKPSAFIKTSDLLLKSVQLDMTARLFYKDNYWAGVSYRTNDAVIIMFGLRYENFYIANAFDFTVSDIRKTTIGSFEINVAAKFGEPVRKYKWLNSF
jgi:type IX secretion system PorP/SprF family membrane protein